MAAFYVGYNRCAMRTDASPKKNRLPPALAAAAWLLCAYLPPAAPARSEDTPSGAGTIESLWSRGESAFKAGDLDQALRLFETALSIDARRARSWNYVGGAHFAQGDLTRALEEFRKAFELDPGDVRACNNVGTALERLGDYAGAEASYARAALIDPKYPVTQRNLGILLSRRLGDQAAARRAWQRYLELAPSGEYADEIRRELAADPPPTAR
jgi:tetratricopeptide (TPR) repeat protein